MKKYIDTKARLFNLFFNFLFYIMLIILICSLIYPYTSFSYRKPFYMPFSMRLNKTDVKLRVGDSFHLYVVNINKRVTYTSDDFKVATVNLSGTVRAWRKGSAIIKVKVKGGKTLKCRVNVVERKD